MNKSLINQVGLASMTLGYVFGIVMGLILYLLHGLPGQLWFVAIAFFMLIFLLLGTAYSLTLGRKNDNQSNASGDSPRGDVSKG